ncbi:hypothetical protein Q4E93_05015 [Flavitalea sp. BT771]|uniref:hypothetical protein n=1 Tax=Flavitalea sp. BT771 TaxID=3063329 RepID=UPI0026E1F8F5|nr:hypothetical protein [Flavitalea sp. BT771]MDO6429931.1 hypothetical protein [Flavitalea sp. BT771]MDV6217941.1 hypothetical protein [Flavitalea sp. BT771]
MNKKPSLLHDVLPVVILFFSAIAVFSGCKKGGPGGDARPAKGSLQNSKGDCLPGTVHGAWYSGVQPGTDTNYVEIGVNVSRTGYYRIVSDAQNGVTFADSGVFTAIGQQTVRLKASGVFTNPSLTGFTITFDHSVCGFSIRVDTLPLADNSWRFTAQGHVYSGTCSYHPWYIPNHTGTLWDFSGQVPSGDTLLFMELSLPPDTYLVTPGAFPTNVNSSFNFYMPGGPNVPYHIIFSAASDKPDKVVTIVITGYTFKTHDGFIQYLGTFSGTANDSTGAPVTITNGVFRVGGS